MVGSEWNLLLVELALTMICSAFVRNSLPEGSLADVVDNDDCVAYENEIDWYKAAKRISKSSTECRLKWY